MAGRVAGKVAIVTGAAHGMGAAHALALAREGADVAAVDICQDRPGIPYEMGAEAELNRVVADMKALGHRAIPVKCDVSKAASVEQMAKSVADKLGRIDILVNNAAVISYSPFADLTEELWNLVMDVNLKGTFLCCKYVVPHMVRQGGGKIVNIGSTSGRIPDVAAVHYATAKAGVHMFTHALAKAVAEHKINVNCVAPGAVRRTAMHKWALDAFGAAMNITPDEFYQRELDAITILGQEITPEDVANAMLFLVSEESRNLTGYVIYVDGGFPGYKW